MDFPRLTDAEALAQLPAADEAERIADRVEPRAKSVAYDAASGRIVVELKAGSAFAFPPELFPELAGRTPEQLARVELDPSGEGLLWDQLGVGMAVAGILVSILGDAMLRAFASRGGSSTSERKAAAARANGRKGGRPRKRDAPRPPSVPYRTDLHFGVMSAREQLLDPNTGEPAAQGDESEDEVWARRSREARQKEEQGGA